MKALSLFTFIFFLFTIDANAQSKKAIVKYGIKSSTETITEENKTTNSTKITYTKTGEVAEEIDYNKQGEIKEIKRFVYNKNDKEIEENVFSPANVLIEKKTTKYNLDGDKLEEVYYKGGKKTKSHVYIYNAKGLKTEKRTLDEKGEVVSVHRFMYN